MDAYIYMLKCTQKYITVKGVPSRYTEQTMYTNILGVHIFRLRVDYY